MKLQGLRVEDSQIAEADGLMKLVAIAAAAAAVILQLVQARDGCSRQPASNAFRDPEIAVLEVLNDRIEGKTLLQKNPHPKTSMRWAAWIVGRLGGWDGYPSSRKPGPITMRNGLKRLSVLAEGWSLRDLCMP